MLLVAGEVEDCSMMDRIMLEYHNISYLINASIFLVFLIDRCKVKRKRQSKTKQENKVIEIDMMRIDPGTIGFTSGFSQEHKYYSG